MKTKENLFTKKKSVTHRKVESLELLKENFRLLDANWEKIAYLTQ